MSYVDEMCSEEQTMDIPLAFALRDVLSFEYIYDFGSETRLRLHIVDKVDVGPGPEQIHLLALNNTIPQPCSFCSKTATWTDPVGWGKDQNYCDVCMKKAEDPELLLPLVNSPRCGVCGYGLEYED